MTNWPNIQEYRNFEAKFINDPTNYLSINSAAESGSILKDDCKIRNTLDEFLTGHHLYQNEDVKTVRCVIKKDFEEVFKKLDRGDGVGISHETPRAKPQEEAVANQLLVDQMRLENHLKWKKQKDEEYQQKKEAERIAQQKKRREELQLERIKKQREREREEKLREWQEQKTREKEEKKKEKMVMKVLEEELKVTPTVDKEKLIGEWVKLKDKQKQMEAEKKAELQKKEEENRELRQNLAKLSYKKWKESIKGRMLTLPKNGYQIFGPKPAPVVKEDWNHDFTSSSPRNQRISVRHTKSNISTLTFRPGFKEVDGLTKTDIYLEGLKTRSPSFYHLRTAKSGLNLTGNCEGLPLKELQQGAIYSPKNAAKSLKKEPAENEDFVSQYISKISNVNFYSKLNEKEKYTYLNQNSPNFLSFLSTMDEDHNQFADQKQRKKLATFSDHQVLPDKKKLDLYINAGSNYAEEFPPADHLKKQSGKVTDGKLHKEGKKDSKEKNTPKDAVEIKSKETFRSRTHVRSTSLQKGSEANGNLKNSRAEEAEKRVCRKSRSCEKPVKKSTKEPSNVKYSSSSRSLAKENGKIGERCEKFKATRSMTCCVQKKKSKKQVKPEIPASSGEKNGKKTVDSVSKTNKKLKKNGLLKSFSFSDSPYNAKNSSKSLSKVKSRRKIAKDGQGKSDEAGNSLKSSTTKV